MQRLFLLVLLVFSMPTLAAQTVIPGSVDDINAIKLQQDCYVFAEYTGKTESDALENVKSLLEDQIVYWASMNTGKDTPKLGDARIIVIQRGPYYRAFAFVATDKKPSNKPSKVETEEPEPVVEENKVVLQEPVTGSPLSEIRTFDQVKPFIDALEEKGLLIDYGKFATLPESGNCYIVIYDRNGSIVTRLKRENKEIRNMDTGSLDGFSNYPGCGAIWFRTFNGKLN